ncbi:hypothetical protein GBA63_21100 [Rubrobacter tropicus]|uniref:GAP family protein n=1 Tax=Rubrobacter tropicus TaxID=2653851 RepID=A0A6G8QEN4_9ACTN|nr:GAP family protein [Rubrobacter tropicus]QIN84861.1 hypothetical protein GBA63_21100 [Rubrobacter tropicus]
MTAGLLLSLLALALLDSLNPVTIAGAVVLLLTPRPVPRTLSFVTGACLAYFAGGVLLYLGLGAAFGRVLDYLGGPWVHALLVVLGAVMVAAGVWIERSPPRKGVRRSFKNLHPAVTFVIGANVTASDLPTAFPLIVAAERVAQAGLGWPGALASLALYVAVYALPLLLLLGGYLLLRGGAAGFLRDAERLIDRWSRPVTIWSLYVIGALLLLNGGWSLVQGWPPL